MKKIKIKKTLRLIIVFSINNYLDNIILFNELLSIIFYLEINFSYSSEDILIPSI